MKNVESQQLIVKSAQNKRCPVCQLVCFDILDYPKERGMSKRNKLLQAEKSDDEEGESFIAPPKIKKVSNHSKLCSQFDS